MAEQPRISGLVDLPGLSAKFECTILRYKTRLSGSTRERRGRGGGVFRTVRWVFSSGSVVLSGKIRMDGWPNPDAWKGQTGTVTIQVQTGKTVAYPVLVTESGLDYDYERTDKSGIVLACDVTGLPTYTGWGTGSQPAATDPTKADQIQWSGSTKTTDPNYIQGQATRRIDIWGTLTDSDAAEQTKLLAVVSAATPPLTDPHNYKLRTSTFERDALDGGTIVETWGLNSTADDVINAAESKTVDPDDLNDQQTTAALNGTPGAPDDTTLFELPTVTEIINDSVTLSKTPYGRVTPLQSIINGGTNTADDPDDFGITATVRLVEANATVSAPSAPHGVLVGWDVRKIRDANGAYTGRWQKDYFYGTSTRKQSIENEGYFSVDVSGIGDQDVQTLTGTSSTAPSDPSTRIAGLVITRRQAFKIQNTPEKWKFRYTFGRLTAEEAIEHRGTSATATNVTPGSSSIINTETLLSSCSSGDSIEDLVNAAWSTYRNTAGFDSVGGSKVNKTVQQIRVRRINDDLVIVESGAFVREEQLGVLAGGTSGAVAIQDAREAATGEFYVLVGTSTAYVSYKTITLIRRKTGINNADDVRFRSLEGYVNNASFLGYPSDTCMFQGVTQRTNWGLESTDHTQLFMASFRYRNIGHFSDAVIRPSVGRWIVSDTTATAGGTLALNQIKSSYIASAPGDADFSTFLA